jgi:hypothetical protein
MGVLRRLDLQSMDFGFSFAPGSMNHFPVSEDPTAAVTVAIPQGRAPGRPERMSVDAYHE